MSLLKPPRLQPGDRVALLSPASAPKNAVLLRQACSRLEALGLRVIPGPHAASRLGYLAGTDQERARDLKNAFLDPAVKGIFCTRGGYGCARLLEAFDPAVAAAHPKILVGYSDMTTLHLALLGKGLVSFWGPMPGTSCWSLFSQKHLLRALMSAEPLGPLPFMSRHRPETLRPGRAEGGLTGGTLTLLASSLGTPYAVATQGKIVFLEDVGEEPYKVDRMLTQLLAAGKLKDAAGIAVGIFTETEPKVYNRRTSLTLRDVLADRLLPLKIPVLTGLTVGHIPDQLTLPYGVRVRMDARAKTLSVIESGVA